MSQILQPPQIMAMEPFAKGDGLIAIIKIDSDFDSAKSKFAHKGIQLKKSFMGMSVLVCEDIQNEFFKAVLEDENELNKFLNSN